METVVAPTETGAKTQSSLREKHQVYPGWLNKLLIAGMLIIMTSSLAMVVLDVWTWTLNTQAFLVSLFLLSGHSAYKQIKVADLQRQLQKAYQGHDQESQNTRLLALLKVTQVMGKSDVQSILDEVTKTCHQAFECQRVSIMLVKEGSQDLEVRSAAGDFREDILGQTQPIGSGISGQVAGENKPIILGNSFDTKRFRDFKTKRYEISASMVIPITLREDMVGVLNITSRSPDSIYVQSDLQVAQVFAEIVAICIRHAQQGEWMRSTIKRLGHEVDGRNVKEAS